MADIKNLKAFCEGMTKDEEEFLSRAEFIKLKGLMASLSPQALVNLQTLFGQASNLQDAHPALHKCITGTATTAFSDPVIIQQFERILELREEVHASNLASFSS